MSRCFGCFYSIVPLVMESSANSINIGREKKNAELLGHKRKKEGKTVCFAPSKF